LWLRQISYDGVSEKAELIEMVHELYEAAGSESSASEEEDHEGPHPLVEKVAATVAEEDSADRTMWLLDSIEDFVRATRYKVCMEDIIYEAISDEHVFDKGSREQQKKELVQDVESLLGRISVETRSIHYDKLGPGGSKQLSGMSTTLVVNPPKQKNKGKKRKVKSGTAAVRITWTAFYDPGASGTEWLEESVVAYMEEKEPEGSEEEEGSEDHEEQDPFQDVLTVRRGADSIEEATMFSAAKGLYESLKVDIPQQRLMQILLLMLRAEEPEVMGHPWSSFMDQGDSHDTLRSVVDSVLKAAT